MPRGGAQSPAGLMVAAIALLAVNLAVWFRYLATRAETKTFRRAMAVLRGPARAAQHPQPGQGPHPAQDYPPSAEFSRHGRFFNNEKFEDSAGDFP